MHDPLAVGDGVHVEFERIFQVVVDQHRAIRRGGLGMRQVVGQRCVVVRDLHGPAAKHVRGPHQHRIADACGHAPGRIQRLRRAPVRAGDVELAQQLAEAHAILGQVDGVGQGAPDRHAGLGQAVRQVERRLPAELDDHAVGLFLVDDVEDILQRQRLEVEPVGGVVVGADRLRVAVDHDGLVAQLFERKAGVNAAIVELDPLADAVRAAAEDDDLPIVGRLGLVTWLRRWSRDRA